MSRMELRLPHLNDELISRLYNWKFGQAAGRLDGTEPEEVTDTVQALAQTFGDVGWFGGDRAGLPTVVRAAVASLIGYEMDDTEVAEVPDGAVVSAPLLQGALETLIVGAAYGAGCKLSSEQCQALFAEIEQLREQAKA